MNLSVGLMARLDATTSAAERANNNNMLESVQEMRRPGGTHSNHLRSTKRGQPRLAQANTMQQLPKLISVESVDGGGLL